MRNEIMVRISVIREEDTSNLTIAEMESLAEEVKLLTEKMREVRDDEILLKKDTESFRKKYQLLLSDPQLAMGKIKSEIEEHFIKIQEIYELCDRDSTLSYVLSLKDEIDNGDNISRVDQIILVNMVVNAIDARTTKEKNPVADALMAGNITNTMRDRQYGVFVGWYYLLNGNKVNKAINEAVDLIYRAFNHQISPTRLKEIWSKDKTGHISRAQAMMNEEQEPFAQIEPH